MKIVLFDDHELFAHSIKLALLPFFQQLESYTDVDDVLDIIKKEKPDIVLMDIHLKDKNGLDVGAKILQQYPEQKLIFLSGYDYVAYLDFAKSIGASGFINKNRSLDELVASIQAVAQGKEIFPNYQKSLDELTPKEKEVLQLSAEGFSQQAIAEQLLISRRTVSTHLQHVLEKLQVNSTISAVMKGIELGLIRIKI